MCNKLSCMQKTKHFLITLLRHTRNTVFRIQQPFEGNVTNLYLKCLVDAPFIQTPQCAYTVLEKPPGIYKHFTK